MSGKKNKKLRKMMKNRAKAAARPAPAPEDHSVPDDVAARLLSQIPADIRDRTVASFQYDSRLRYKPISAALFDVADPWVRAADDVGMDDAHYKSYLKFLCTMAMFAWNLKSIGDKAVRQSSADEMLKILDTRFGKDGEGRAMCTDTLLGMMERAIDLYPDDMREVASVELVEENGRQKLYAACTMPSTEVPEAIRAELAAKQFVLTAPGELPTPRIVDLDLAAKNGAPSEAPGSAT